MTRDEIEMTLDRRLILKLQPYIVQRVYDWFVIYFIFLSMQMLSLIRYLNSLRMYVTEAMIFVHNFD